MYPFLSINISRSWQPIILLFLDHCCASLGEYFTMVFTKPKPQRIKLVEYDNDNDWIQNVWFSDEAHFHLNGSVNRQNVRYWCSIRPHDVLEVPLHSPKCTAWCAMSAKALLVLYGLWMTMKEQ